MLPQLSTLRGKLALVFLLFISLMGALAFISHRFLRAKEKLTATTLQLDSVLFDCLNAARVAQYFYHYDSADTLFYQLGRSNNLDRHRQSMRQIDAVLSQLTTSPEVVPLGIRPDLASLRERIKHYQILFEEVVTLTQQRGFKDYGLEGTMRRFAHALEDSEPSLEALQLLTLRRHEKDYIIRKDPAYADKFERLCSQVHERLRGQSPRYHHTDSLLTGYQMTFRQLVAVENAMGINHWSGARGQLRNLTNGIEASLNATTAKANQQAARLNNQLAWQYGLVLLFAVLLSVLMSFLLAYAITRPVRALSEAMARTVEGNFDTGLEPVAVTTHDEVGVLTQNFNTMVEKMQEKTLSLQAKNQQLQSINWRLTVSEQQLKGFNALKDKFFVILSHDLRGPLLTVHLFLEMLCKDAASFTAGELEVMANQMNTSVNHLLELLSNLLQWSSFQAGELKCHPVIVNVKNVASKNTKLFQGTAHLKHITLSNRVPATALALVDADMLDFILRNLLSNAMKFTGADGTVDVYADTSSQSVVVVEVSDTGVGIQPEDLDKLLNDDHHHHSTLGTAQEKGTGLGLMLCRDFARRNGGELTVRSEWGKGTTVRITLPRADLPAVHPSAPARQEVIL